MHHYWLYHHLSMTKPLLAILLLLPLPVSAGELDGKAITCVNAEPANLFEWELGKPTGYEFKAGRVIRYSIRTEGTLTRIQEYDFKTDYWSEVKTVTFTERANIE